MRHIILIPGLGNAKSDRMYLWLRPLWQLFGLKLHVFEINWEDGRDFAGKYRSLKQLAKRLPQPLGVVAISAGASTAVNMLALNPELVNGVVTVCGLLDLEYLDTKTMNRRSPAFVDALTAADCYLDDMPELTSKMMTIRPLSDKTVDPKVATTPGAKDVRVGSRGHALSIAYILIFKVGLIKKFLISV